MLPMLVSGITDIELGLLKVVASNLLQIESAVDFKLDLKPRSATRRPPAL